MSSIKFEGFPSGQPVALRAAIGAQSSTGSIVAWGGQKASPTEPTDKSVQVHVVRAAGPAPMAAFLEARVSGFAVSGQEAERKLDYLWDFGTPEQTSGALTARSDALWGRGTNTSYLPRVSHTYDTPGQYTAQVWVSDGVDVVTDSVQVVVDDPNVTYAGTRTIYVDPDGTLNVQHAGAPAGAQYATTTAEAYTKWQAFDSAGGRILFARSKTHAPFPDQFTDAKQVMLGAYGSGAKPIIATAGTGKDGIRPTEHVLGFRCSDIHVTSGWDGTTETGSNLSGVAGNVDSDVLIHNCEFTNCDKAIHLNAAGTDAGFYAQISNNKINSWRNYGILFPAPQYAGFVGNEIKQNPDALGGGLGKNINKHEHGPIRTSAVRASGFVTFRKNELFTNTSWTTADGCPSHQPCIRWASSGGQKDATGFFEQNILEGGVNVLSLQPGSSPNANRGNIIVQMNYMIRSANSTYISSIDFTGVVIRNNVLVTPAVLAENQNFGSLRQVLAVKRSNWVDADHEAALVEVYNNTHVDLRDNTHFGGSLRWFQGGDLSLPANVIHQNNAVCAPNLSNTGDIVVDTATVLFAPHYKGLKWANEPVLDTSFATPQNSAVAATPVAGSTGVTGLTAIRDLLGTLRPADGSIRTVGARQFTD